MPLSRTDFMKLFGVSLASLLLARCGRFSLSTSTPRDRLRGLWFQFDELAKNSRNGMGDENAFGQRLVSEHRSTLDEIVASGELSAPAADLVQEAYDAAVYHVWRSNAPITCYEPVMVDFAPTSASELVHQSEALGQLAEQGAVDPATLAKAQAAIEHDMAFYELTDQEIQALYDRLIQENMQSGGAMPPFAELELELSPQAREAARFLVDLLTQK